MKKKILLVDDDALQLRIISGMLCDEYEIYIAKSGDEALKILYHNNFVPNLILLDILMPEMDGWEAFNRIKALGLLRNAPVAFLTSIDGSVEKTRAFELGAVDFIIKSDSKENLVNRIKKITG
jgi:putative two-component system response regulator